MMAGFFLMMSTSSLNGFVAATATASSLGQLAHVVSGAIGSVLGGAGGGKVLAMGAGVLAVDGQTGEMPKQQQLLRQYLCFFFGESNSLCNHSGFWRAKQTRW